MPECPARTRPARKHLHTVTFRVYEAVFEQARWISTRILCQRLRLNRAAVGYHLKVCFEKGLIDVSVGHPPFGGSGHFMVRALVPLGMLEVTGGAGSPDGGLPPRDPPVGKEKTRIRRKCLKCKKTFTARHKNNWLCKSCFLVNRYQGDGLGGEM